MKMPILETGNKEGGFSLIELMVVLAIIGMMGAVIAIRMPRGDGPPFAEAETLAVQMQAVRMEAISTARSTRITLGPDGLAVAQRRKLQWAERSLRDFGIKPSWPDGVSARPAAIIFEPTGLATGPRDIFLTRGAAAARIVIDPQGDVRVQR